MHVVSTCAVEQLVDGRLGVGISKIEASRIRQGLDQAVTAFRTRLLGHAAFP